MSARSYLELPAFSSSGSLLGRVSFSNAPSLSSLQNQVDQAVSAFAHQASDWKSLASMMAGAGAYRFGRMGVLGMGNAPALKALSFGAGLSAEVATFELAHRSLQSGNSNLWRWEGSGGLRQGLIQSFITFGTLKGAGRLAQGQNFLAQHLLQDSAMVLGHQASAALGFAPRPEGGLAEQFLHAEATNLSMGAGLSLAHTVAPGVSSLERGLDLTLNFPIETGSRFPNGKGAGLAYAAAGSGPGPISSEKTSFRPTILAMSKMDDSGSSNPKEEKTLWLNPSEGLGADLLVFHPEKKAEAAPVQDLTEEWRGIFEKGGRILSMGGGHRLVGFSSEAPPAVTEKEAKAFEAWRILHGFTKTDFETARKSWEDLFQRLKRNGVALSYQVKGGVWFPSSLKEIQDSPWALHGGPLKFLGELAALLPDELFALRDGQRPVFREVRWLLDSTFSMGSDERLCNAYQDGALYLPASLLRGSRSRLAEWFLHGIGHGVARYFHDDRAMEGAYRDILKGHTLWGLHWGEPPEMRTRRQRGDFGEFVTETLLGYVMASSVMKDYAKYSPTPLAWERVYDKFRRLFDGREYEYGLGPARKAEGPLVPSAPEHIQLRGGVIARWLIELIPSVGLIGNVERIDESRVILDQVFQKKNGADEELGKKVEIEGAQIRGSDPLKRGDRVHYLPPVAGGSGEGSRTPAIGPSNPATPVLPGPSRFYSAAEANTLFFRWAQDWMKNEVIPRLGTDWGQSWVLDQVLFEPLGHGERLPSREIRELLSEIRKLPPELRRVMEYTLPVDPGEQVLEFVVYLHWEFSRMGLHLYGRDENGDVRLRLPSPPLLEVFLKSRFGNQALSFLYDRGETPPDEAVGLLRRGARTVGFSSDRIQLNGRRVHPFPYALHDLYHIVRFSSAIPAWMRVAAALYYETHRDYLLKTEPPAGIRYHSESQMARIADLGLYTDFKLSAFISNYVSDMRADKSLIPAERHQALKSILTIYLHKTYERASELDQGGIVNHRRVLRNILESLFSPSLSDFPTAPPTIHFFR